MNIAQNLYGTAKSQTQSFFSSFYDLEGLRPLFDVELKQVARRAALSLVPRMNPSSLTHYDLYGPLIIGFLLVLLFQHCALTPVSHPASTGLPSSDRLGENFGLVFTYWLVIALIVKTFVYFSESNLTNPQVVAFTGYSLIGSCVAQLFALYFLLARGDVPLPVLGVPILLAAFSLGSVYFHSTPLGPRKLLLSGAVVLLHFVLLLHLSWRQTQRSLKLRP